MLISPPSPQVNKKFSASYKATIGADFLTREVLVDDRQVTMQLIAGKIALGHGRPRTIPITGRGLLSRRRLLRPRLRCQQRQELRGAGQLEGRVPHPGFSRDPPNFPFVVLGNKIDVEESKRVISNKRAMTFCQSKGDIPYFETSAKEAINIDQAFEVIARNALAQEESEEFSGDFDDPINIHIENDRDGCAC
ncbi:hypothetical protein MRS44_012367 [Fusarium solani]|uniref:uncharacterized protein n=1 Tax=Fusarium solani TaxID=169388 RepID=UPI0032C41E70|nr:hypothetical protein MRS44_012367 [Fusarium solani]